MVAVCFDMYSLTAIPNMAKSMPAAMHKPVKPPCQATPVKQPFPKRNCVHTHSNL